MFDTDEASEPTGMRAPKNNRLGTTGQTRVKGQFEDMDWGPLPNLEHDIGTDLFVMVRDARRFDLGVVLGVQVKAGSSWFREPQRDASGRIEGWWFRDGNDLHFDYWCEHAVPHILVLHDYASHVSYWVHVTRERVESTGKGFKILVPESNRIDADHRDALIEVAAEGVQIADWEGSVWRSGDEVPASVRLRYAIMLPRLVSPHPNRGFDDLDAHEALALLVQMRIDDLARSKQASDFMDGVQPCATTAWEWHLFAALYRWLDERSIDGLIDCVGSARTVRQRVAAITCASFARLERDEVPEAVATLESELGRDEADRVDHGWLRAHLARCHLERGDLAAAGASALEVRRLAVEAPRDPSARALVAAASQTLLAASDFGDADIEGTVRANDTPSTWWRSQMLASGLERQFRESFDAWAGNDRTVYMQDVARNQLRSAMIVSGVSADGPSWAYAASMLGRRILMGGPEDEREVVDSLDLLRRSGNDEVLQRAAAKIRREGPVQALASAAAEVDLDRAARSSLRTSLRLVELAADVSTVDVCDRRVLWAVAVFPDARELERTLRPDFLVGDAVLDMLVALVPCCSAAVRRQVIESLSGLPAVADTILEGSLASLVSCVPDDEWTEDNIDALDARDLQADSQRFRNAIEGVLASRRPNRRTALLERIQSGDLEALAAWGNVTELPEAAVPDIVASLAANVEEQTEEARRGVHRLGGSDRLHALTVVNLWHADAARWSPVETALELERSDPSHLAATIRALGQQGERVPAAVRDRMRTSLTAITGRARPDPDRRGSRDIVDVRGEAFATLAAWFPEEADDGTLRRMLWNADTVLGCAALHVLGGRRNPDDLTLLAVLARAEGAGMQEAAVVTLATWVADGIASPASDEVLGAVLHADGTRLGRHASRALRPVDQPGTPSGNRLASLLRTHPSAFVRRRAAKALGV